MMGTFSLRPMTTEDITFIVANMRKSDRREIFATHSPSEQLVIQHCHHISDQGAIAYWGDEPVCFIGAVPSHGGVWDAFMFGTDKIPKIGKSLTKFVRTVMLPKLFELGAHRVQAYTIEGHEWAHRWLRSFGAKEEARLSKYGSNKEDFFIYVITPESFMASFKKGL